MTDIPPIGADRTNVDDWFDMCGLGEHPADYLYELETLEQVRREDAGQDMRSLPYPSAHIEALDELIASREARKPKPEAA